MKNENENENYGVGKTYILYAQGFPEAIEGKIVEITEAGEDKDVLLVIEKTDGTITNVFQKAISGWTEVQNKSLAA